MSFIIFNYKKLTDFKKVIDFYLTIKALKFLHLTFALQDVMLFYKFILVLIFIERFDFELNFKITKK